MLKLLFNNRLHAIVIHSILSLLTLAFVSCGPSSMASPNTFSSIAEDDTSKSFPTIMIKNGSASQPLGMNDLKVDVRVVGNIAVTTLDMTFYNNENRILEGELYFPLAQGQTVSRFAMEVNGKLREGVVVEKEKGRVAFESTIRKNIDPGLLEWTKGNNFKSRVYPIPANGYKRIVVAYEQELQVSEDNYIYYLPMNFPEKLKTLNVSVNVFNQNIKPQFEPQSFEMIEFKKWEENYSASYSSNNSWAKTPLVFAIPESNYKPKVLIEQGKNGQYYFYTRIKSSIKSTHSNTPKTATLLWDVSSSRENNLSLEKETNLIKEYINEFRPKSIEFIAFSNTIHKKITFNTSNGDPSKLIEEIKATYFDGATQYGEIDLAELKGDQILLFSDGLSNFGKKDFLHTTSKPIYCFNSSQIADHSNLQSIGISSNGAYFNLNKLNHSWESIKKSLTSKIQNHLRIKSTHVSDVYPKRINDLSTDWITISGKLNAPSDQIEIYLDYSTNQSKSSIEKIQLDVEKQLTTSGLIERIWAQKKLAHLDLDPIKNKHKIIALGKQYSIVTRGTSLIVLDRVEDYVEHKITPPEELLEAYNQLISTNEKEIEKNNKQHLEEVYTNFKTRMIWWEKEFKPVYKAKESSKRMMSHEAVSDADMEDVSEMAVSADEISNSYLSGSAAAEKNTKNTNEKGQPAISLAPWIPDAPYLKELKNSTPEELINKYLELKKENKNNPSFFLDVSDLYLKRGLKKEALRVLSNIAELELENHELLRILAHRLEQLKYYDLAIQTFLDVKGIRAEEPQTFRDLGLVYALNNQGQKAIEALYQVVTTNWDDRFPGIEDLVAYEINSIISKSKEPLDISFMDDRFIKSMPTDIRVVLNWDTDNCDMDLWVIDPNGEKCFYSHKLTQTGGRISNDFTRGYGPEEFMIKKALPGEYKVQVNYYGTSSQKLSGPTTIQVKLITNYGKETEKSIDVTRRLGTSKEVLDIGAFSFTD